MLYTNVLTCKHYKRKTGIYIKYEESEHKDTSFITEERDNGEYSIVFMGGGKQFLLPPCTRIGTTTDKLECYDTALVMLYKNSQKKRFSHYFLELLQGI